MPDPTRFRRVVLSILLIALVLAVTLGMVWHHHDGASASNCTLCHLSIAPWAAAIGAIGLLITTAEYPVRENGFVSRRRANKKPPRAPPI